MWAGVGSGSMTIPSLSAPLCPEAKPVTPNSSGIPGAPFRAQGGSAAQGPRDRQGGHPSWVSGPSVFWVKCQDRATPDPSWGHTGRTQ